MVLENDKKCEIPRKNQPQTEGSSCIRFEGPKMLEFLLGCEEILSETNARVRVRHFRNLFFSQYQIIRNAVKLKCVMRVMRIMIYNNEQVLCGQCLKR